MNRSRIQDEAHFSRRWGEGALIREIAAEFGVSQSAVWGTAARLRLPPRRAVARGPAEQCCRVPGCGAGLRDSNASGVCQRHLHLQPHCGCAKCRREDAAEAAGERRAARPGYAEVARLQAAGGLTMVQALQRFHRARAAFGAAGRAMGEAGGW